MQAVSGASCNFAFGQNKYMKCKLMNYCYTYVKKYNRKTFDLVSLLHWTQTALTALPWLGKITNLLSKIQK